MTLQSKYLDRMDESRIVVPVAETPSGVRCRVYWRRGNGWDFEPIADTMAKGFGGFATLPARLFDSPVGFTRLGS